MKSPPQALRLRTEVLIWRHGVVWLLIPLLLVTTLALWAAQHLYFEPQRAKAQMQVQALEAELRSLSMQASTPAASPASATTRAWSEMRNVLTAEAEVPAVIRALHASAERHGVTVLSSDFQRQALGQTGVIQQSVVMPFRASYAGAKAFLFDVLRSHPGLSLDQITIKREAVEQANPEMRVKFSIRVAADGAGLTSPSAPGASE